MHRSLIPTDAPKPQNHKSMAIANFLRRLAVFRNTNGRLPGPQDGLEKGFRRLRSAVEIALVKSAAAISKESRLLGDFHTLRDDCEA